jgi:PAS domain S-box-containing protein
VVEGVTPVEDRPLSIHTAHSAPSLAVTPAFRRIFTDELAPDLYQIIDSIPYGVYGLDPKGELVFANQAAASMLGYEPVELIGRVPHLVMHHTRPDGTPYPADECPLHQAAIEGRELQVEEDLFWRRDGTSLPVQYESHPLRRNGLLVGFIVTFRDISARKKNEERLRDLLRDQFALARAEFQHAQLREVLKQLPAVVCVTRGPRHLLEVVNEQFTELVGDADTVGKPLADVLPAIHEQVRTAMTLAYDTGVAQRGQELAVEVETPDGGQTKFFDYIFQPLRDESGFVYGLMTHAVEVTDEVVSRRALETRTEELSHLTQVLRRTNAELDAFAYAASHDLRAPLRGIANLAQWIEEDLSSTTELKPDTREMLALMRSRMHRMEALIEGILQYSRAGRVGVKIEAVDTRTLVQEVIDLLSPDGAAFELGELPTFATTLLPLQQVFMNLIGNALKYANRPDPVVRIEAREAGSFYEFSVSDNGPGIPPEYQTKIWGIFQTLEARDRVEGTGIGLSLVKKLVDANGGRAWVESTPGEGATFRFLWPKRIRESFGS